MKRVLRAEMLAPTPIDGVFVNSTALSNRQFLMEWDGQMLIHVTPRSKDARGNERRPGIVPLTACKSLTLMTDADLATEAEEISAAEARKSAIAEQKAKAKALAAMSTEERLVAAVQAKVEEKAARERADDTRVMRKNAAGEIVEMSRAEAKALDEAKAKQAEPEPDDDLFDGETGE